MPLVSALVLPHGTMPFDGDPSLHFSDETTTAAQRVKTIPPELKKDCSAIFTLTNDAVQSVLNTRPDVIFLNTPHGICLSDSMGVYTNPKATGNAEWNGQWDEYSIEVDLDTTLSKGLIHHLRGDGIPVEGITCFSCYDSPLRWGEVVPLWYLKPLLGPAKTIKPSSGVWDAVTLKQAKQWLDRAFFLRTTALSCGINGFCMLQGMLEAEISCQTVEGSRTSSFSTTLFCRLAPTYYGMMSASFIKQDPN